MNVEGEAGVTVIAVTPASEGPSETPIEGTGEAVAVIQAASAEASAQAAEQAAAQAIALSAGVAAVAEMQAAETVADFETRLAAMEMRVAEAWQTIQAMQEQQTTMSGLLLTLLPEVSEMEEAEALTEAESLPVTSPSAAAESQAQPIARRKTRLL